jgi:hypothetical protein
VPYGAVAAYKAAAVWKDFINIVEMPANSDATLSSLTLSDGVLSPAFSAGVASYTASVAYGVSSITLWATASNAGATVTGTGTFPLATGANTFNITVIAGGNSTQTYTVTVTRLPLGTGIEDELQAEVKLYPNPFADVLHLTGAEGCTLQVINAGGATALTQKITAQDETVHLEGLPAGMYFFRLEKDGETKTVKGIKN